MRANSKVNQEIWMIEMRAREICNYIKASTFSVELKEANSQVVRNKELPLLEQ